MTKKPTCSHGEEKAHHVTWKNGTEVQIGWCDEWEYDWWEGIWKLKEAA